MTRVVVDPNVLVSAFVSRGGSAPDRIVRALRDGAFDLVVSPHLLAELAGVLARPKFDTQASGGRAEAYVGSLAATALVLADPDDPPAVTPDPDDDYLAALAHAAGADCIVSGDPHLTGLDEPVPIVLTPREFADQLGE